MTYFTSSYCLSSQASETMPHRDGRRGYRVHRAASVHARSHGSHRGAFAIAVAGAIGLLLGSGQVAHLYAQEDVLALQANDVPAQDATEPQTDSANEREKVFSGPQPGEPLVGFSSRVVLGGEAGEEVDMVGQAGQNPLLLLFVHEVTRPSIAVIRAITRYATARADDGLRTAVIFLTADATETEAFLQRARHALPPNVLIGISQDGLEGPGEYGLNRNVALTIVLGKKGETTANFALIQPSLQTDVVPVVQSIIDVLGSGMLPPLERLINEAERMERPQRPGGNAPDGVSEDRIRSLLQPLIRRSASPEDVERIAAVVQRELEADPALRRQIGEIASRIVEADKLENYGSPAAQAVLRRWAEAFGPAKSP